jgi:hypothetical protein
MWNKSKKYWKETKASHLSHWQSTILFFSLSFSLIFSFDPYLNRRVMNAYGELIELRIFFSSSIYLLFIADRYYYMPRRRITKIHSIHWHAYYWVRVPAGLRPWVYFVFSVHEYMSDDEITTNERLMTMSHVILVLMCKRFFSW